jgi:hypothetical protein
VGNGGAEDAGAIVCKRVASGAGGAGRDSCIGYTVFKRSAQNAFAVFSQNKATLALFAVDIVNVDMVSAAWQHRRAMAARSICVEHEAVHAGSAGGRGSIVNATGDAVE